MSAHADSGRLLVITLSNVGDLVLTTPVFEALHAHCPERVIDVVGDARSCELLAHAPWLGELFVRDKRAALPAQLRLLLRLRRRRYAVVVDLRTPFLPWLLRAHRRLLKPRRDVPGLHAAEEHFAAVAPVLPAGTPMPAPRVYPGERARERARARLAALPGPRLLALAPGANWPGKTWPAPRYRALLDQAAAHFDAAVVLGGAADREAAGALGGAALPVLDLTGETDLTEAAAVLEQAQAFVGNDSGLGHLAAAAGTPTVTVFGPGRPERYRPWGERARLVHAPGEDLAALAPEPVLEALLALPARAG